MQVPRKVKVPHYIPFQPEEKQCQATSSQNNKKNDHSEQRWPDPPLEPKYFPSLFGQPRRPQIFEDFPNGSNGVIPLTKPSIKEEAANVKEKFSGQLFSVIYVKDEWKFCRESTDSSNNAIKGKKNLDIC